MSDLIDREELKHRMYHEAFETDSELQRWDSGCWIRYKMFEDVIAEMPTAEPERKTGKLSEKKMYLVLYTCAGSTQNRIISSVGSPQSVLDRFIKGRKLTNVLGIYEMHQCEGVKLNG